MAMNGLLCPSELPFPCTALAAHLLCTGAPHVLLAKAGSDVKLCPGPLHGRGSRLGAFDVPKVERRRYPSAQNQQEVCQSYSPVRPSICCFGPSTGPPIVPPPF